MADPATGARPPTCDSDDAMLVNLERQVAVCTRELPDWPAVTMDLPAPNPTILMKH